MSSIFRNAVVLAFTVAVVVSVMLEPIRADEPNPPRLRREDSFLGVHFDLHAGYDCTEIGKTVTPEMIERVIKQVKPDYLQCDCKGHPGISSYPTKVGNPAPGFVKDQLRIWRDVTARHGVALYMHYSGVWDSEAVKQHPEWARIDENGEPDTRLTSVFGPYTEELLIPQLIELNDEYGVDGVWIDGDCWATERDYGETAVRLFREKTGIDAIPKSPDAPYWFEFSEFNRQGFRDHLQKIVVAMHAHNPAFQVCSNWAYSSHMPEPVTVDVDFISGDFSARNSVNAGRFEGRCMVHQGKPWDLMAWSFTWSPGHYSTKSIPQLEREAATVLTLGGGFQAYFPQNRDGSVRQWEWDVNLMGKVAEFCRERQSFCHNAEPVPQIGLLYSGSTFYRTNRKVFSAWHGECDGLKGTLQSLLDAQRSVEIVMEHHLTGRMSEYPLIVIPEWGYLEPSFRNDLVHYVENGGALLAIGPKAAALFEEELGVTLAGEPDTTIVALEHEGWLAGLETLWQKTEPVEEVETFGRLYFDSRNDMKGPNAPAATIRSLGRGKIAAVYFDMGERYLNARTFLARDFLDDLVSELFPEPLVEVSGSGNVDVQVNRIGGRLAVNLVNTSGPHGDTNVLTIDRIDPVGPLTVTVRCDAKPAGVTVEPGGRIPEYTYRDGVVMLKIPSLKIHDIVMIE
ncbi:MAG: hypothetical protein J7M24_01020 [Candidatus Latescibacteria bacterium]|nr:hypothetical protein [Candidatus Latescibacterota bacterium]